MEIVLFNYDERAKHYAERYVVCISREVFSNITRNVMSAARKSNECQLSGLHSSSEYPSGLSSSKPRGHR